MRTLIFAIALHCAAYAQGPPPESVRSPRPAGWIVDQANVLTADQERRLNQQLTALEKSTSAEFALVTIQDTDGRQPKPYATALFNHWGIGKRDKNNGILFLVVMGRRRMEVEVGDGLRTPIPDAWVPPMLTSTVVPEFRRGSPGVGIEKGVQQLISRVPQPMPRLRSTLGPLWSQRQVAELQQVCDAERIQLVVEKHTKPVAPQLRFQALKLGPRGYLVLFDPATGQTAAFGGSQLTAPELAPLHSGKTPTERAAALHKDLLQHLRAPEAAPAAPLPPTRLAAPVSHEGPADLPSPWTLLFLAPGGPALYFWAKYRRQRTCPGCRRRLALVSEKDDDAHLTPAENLEENLSSVDHMVWVCSGCDYTKKEAWNAWLSGYSGCPGCFRRALSTESRTITAATYHSSGHGLRIRDCRNCGFHDESTYTIPRKTKSSSSSSSGSSSSSSGFGGGRSSGGGGGASW